MAAPVGDKTDEDAVVRLPDTPFWALFRLKLRRAWPARTRRRALLALVIILAVQAGATWLYYWVLLAGPGRGRMITASGRNETNLRWRIRTAHGSVGRRFASFPTQNVMTYLGFALTGFASGTGLVSSLWVPVYPSLTRYIHLAPQAAPMIACSVVDAILRFIMPACAAQALAPDRQSGQSEDYLLAGLAPWQVLLASACASVAPFAALVLGTVAAAAFTDAALRGAAGVTATRLQGWNMDYSHILVWGVAFLVQAGVLVSISAICRRAPAAIIACYAVHLLVPPAARWGAYYVAVVASGPRGGGVFLWGWAGHAAQMGAALALLAALLPLALRALRHCGASSAGRPM